MVLLPIRCPHCGSDQVVKRGKTENTLQVVARFSAHPDKVDGRRGVLSALLEPTRQEGGCITYEMLQNRDDPTDFTFIEEWENEAALQAHLATYHVQEALGKLPELIAGKPDIRRYTLVD